MREFIFVSFLCCSSIISFGQNKLDGYYLGVEEMCSIDSLGYKECYTDPGAPKRKWYHLTKMRIKGDSIFWNQSPISIYKKDTTYSASDGGFYYYGGNFSIKDNVLAINLTQLSCDYCGRSKRKQSDGTLVEIKRTKQFEGILTNKGIIIKGYLFTKRNDENYN